MNYFIAGKTKASDKQAALAKANYMDFAGSPWPHIHIFPEIYISEDKQE